LPVHAPSFDFPVVGSLDVLKAISDRIAAKFGAAPCCKLFVAGESKGYAFFDVCVCLKQPQSAAAGAPAMCPKPGHEGDNALLAPPTEVNMGFTRIPTRSALLAALPGLAREYQFVAELNVLLGGRWLSLIPEAESAPPASPAPAVAAPDKIARTRETAMEKAVDEASMAAAAEHTIASVAAGTVAMVDTPINVFLASFYHSGERKHPSAQAFLMSADSHQAGIIRGNPALNPILGAVVDGHARVSKLTGLNVQPYGAFLSFAFTKRFNEDDSTQQRDVPAVGLGPPSYSGAFTSARHSLNDLRDIFGPFASGAHYTTARLSEFLNHSSGFAAVLDMPNFIDWVPVQLGMHVASCILAEGMDVYTRAEAASHQGVAGAAIIASWHRSVAYRMRLLRKGLFVVHRPSFDDLRELAAQAITVGIKRTRQLVEAPASGAGRVSATTAASAASATSAHAAPAPAASSGSSASPSKKAKPSRSSEQAAAAALERHLDFANTAVTGLKLPFVDNPASPFRLGGPFPTLLDHVPAAINHISGSMCVVHGKGHSSARCMQIINGVVWLPADVAAAVARAASASTSSAPSASS
jgi:hypothetical protein